MGTVKTDALSTTYTSEAYALGTEYVQPADENLAANSTHYGPKTWVFVYNDGTAFAEGDVISIDTSDYAPFHGILCTAAARSAGLILGIAGHAIAAGSYGWIVKKGVCEAKGGGSVNQGDVIVSHTSNQVRTMGSAEEVAILGVALHDDGSAGDLFTVKIDIP